MEELVEEGIALEGPDSPETSFAPMPVLVSVSLSFPFMVRFPVQKSQEGRIRRVAGPLSCSKHVVLPLMSDDVKKVTLFVDAGGNMRLETILKGWGSYDKDRDHYAFRRFANRNPDTHKYHFSDTLKG